MAGRRKEGRTGRGAGTEWHLKRREGQRGWMRHARGEADREGGQSLE